MIEYKIGGNFYRGIPFEDFLSLNKKSPNVTISAEPEKVVAGSDFTRDPNDTDGWIDVYVRRLNPSIARRVLAHINHVFPREIEIIEAHQVVSV
ncbi:MAG: hypothetical protein HZA35_00095 [Parcubacteria group bacterium]|nr:hypothetical protein [Parcubacteria group bacterium]